MNGPASYAMWELCDICGIPVEDGRDTCGCEKDLAP